MPEEQQQQDVDEVRTLLKRDRRTLSYLCQKTGLNYHWLRKLRNGEIKNPGYANFSRLKAFYHAQ
jgi:hypothetical protein